MPVAVDEDAIKKILSSEEFAFLGEPRIKLIAQAYERLFEGHDHKFHGWATPTLRKELWRLLAPQMEQASETRIWMVVRRYRDLKRRAVFVAEEEVRKQKEAEAAAALAAKKAAAKEAAAAKKAAAEAATPGGDDAAPSSEPPKPDAP